MTNLKEQSNAMKTDILKYEKFLCAQQEKQEINLINRTGKLIIAYPIAAWVISMLMPKISIISTGILFVGLLISLLCLAIPSWKLQTFDDEILPDELSDKGSLNDQWTASVMHLGEIKTKANNIRAKCILTSKITFIASILIATAFLVF